MTTTAAPCTAVLTDEQIAEYYREGYLLVRGLAPLDAITRVLAEAKSVAVEKGGRWTPRCFEHATPCKDHKIHELFGNPRIVSAVEQLFDAPARAYFGMLAVVPAGGGSGLQWHQDNQYSLLLGRALNVFIALADVDDDMANLWVSPQSHRIGRQPSKKTDDGHLTAVTPPENGIQLPPLRAGDACIFDRCTLHRSLKNESTKNRYAYAAQYMDLHTRDANTGKIDLTRMPARDLRSIWAKA